MRCFYFLTVNHGTFYTPVGLKSRYWKFVFKHPSDIFISGPSEWGKTEFVKKMIEFKEDLFDSLSQRIVWCYKEWQKSYNILQEREGSNIKIIQGIPDDEDEIVTDPRATH